MFAVFERNLLSKVFKRIQFSRTLIFFNFKKWCNTMHPIDTDETRKLVNEYSTLRYHMTHCVYKANHVTHYICCLRGLGASIEETKNIIDPYCKSDLEDPDKREDEKSKIIDFNNLLGVRLNFYVIVDNFQEKFNKCYEKNIENFISSEIGAYIDAPASGLYHGMIQLAYGYLLKNPRTVIEGMAYMHHSNMPLNDALPEAQLKFTDDQQHFVKVFNSLSENSLLWKPLIDKSNLDEKNKSKTGPLQNRIMHGFSDYPALLIELFNKIKLPNEASSDDLVIKCNVLKKFMFTVTANAFLHCEFKNNFFVLHGVTASWALSKLLPLLSLDDQLKAITAFFISYIATYIGLSCPRLNTKPSQEIISGITEDMWSELCKTARKNHEYEMHTPKLVHCLYDIWQEEKDLGENSGLYYACALSALHDEQTYSTTE